MRRVSTSGATSEETLYHQIMSEPFEGEHWGPGFDEEVREGWTHSGSDDDDEKFLTPRSKIMRAQRASTRQRVPEEEEDDGEERMRAARDLMRDLARKAYWKDGGFDVERVDGHLQGWRQITTGTSAVALAMTIGSPSAPVMKVRLLRVMRMCALTRMFR